MKTNSALVHVLALVTISVALTAATNVIMGTAGPDDLVGTPGDDTINGMGDADVMTGLAGNDTYHVDDWADRVVEQVDDGTDTVRVVGAYSLPANVENLVLVGAKDGIGMGNDLANRMTGNSSSFNTLDGGRGNDVLTGRGGRDEFRFTTALNGKTNVDRVMDFDVTNDTIGLSYKAFPAFTVAIDTFLYPEQFMVGPLATSVRHRIVYNPQTGALYYDSDGSGPAQAVRFAILSPNLALTGLNFWIHPRYFL